MRTNNRPLLTPKMHNGLRGIIQVKEKQNYFWVKVTLSNETQPLCNVCEKKQKQLPNVSACNTLLMTSHIIAREIGKCRPPCLYSEIAISNPTLLFLCFYFPFWEIINTMIFIITLMTSLCSWGSKWLFATQATSCESEI